MRVTAKLGHYEFIMLIDSGSTHNFINEKVANLFQLPLIPTKQVAVRITNGIRLQCQGLFEHVQVILQTIRRKSNKLWSSLTRRELF